MKFGLHASIAGGIFNAPVNAAQNGCETFQLFTRSPRGGAAPALTREILDLFKNNCRQFGFKDYYVHTPYYINLASGNEKIARDSARVIREDLDRASLLGAKALMTHLGSAKDTDQGLAIKKVAEGLAGLLRGYKGTTQFLIEISAGSGQVIGDTFEEVAEIISLTEKKTKHRLGVCFDTAHAFASGYDLGDLAAVNKTFSRFDRLIGLQRLKLLHGNDSKVPLGSHVDRHEHIGRGLIGLDGFRAIIAHPRLDKIDFILETPREEGKNFDLMNLELVKKIRDDKS